MNNKQASQVTRRRFLTSAGLGAGALWLAPLSVFAKNGNLVIGSRDQGAAAKITVQNLRGGVSVLSGAGGNIAVLSGADDKILVDAGLTTSRRGIAEALTRIDANPVRHLINTHWHFDHTDGNEWLNSAGARIIAQENTRKHLSTTTRVEAWDFTFPPSPAGALPTEVFKQDLTLHLNRTTLALRYYGPAHTDSDISVEFAEAEILHTGDTWWNGHFPFIDYSTGGSIDGAIRAAEANITRVTDKTLIIPGHGPVGDKSGLIEFRDMMVTIRDKVAALKRQGRSLDETVAAAPAADYEAKWGGFFINGKTFTSLVYVGV
jgi:glyoxylase-like metal-dependent hydrolase (beta-lactamase superfamily II)